MYIRNILFAFQSELRKKETFDFQDKSCFLSIKRSFWRGLKGNDSKSSFKKGKDKKGIRLKILIWYHLYLFSSPIMYISPINSHE